MSTRPSQAARRAVDAHRDSGVRPRVVSSDSRHAAARPPLGSLGRVGTAVASAALVGAVVLTGCSGSAKKAAPGPDMSNAGGTSSPSTSSALIPTRWWSNEAGSAGATIDAKNPTAGAQKLGQSRDTYCDMLEQTMKSGNSILPGVTANDPALLTSTQAFIAELQKVAPAEVAAAWKTVGDAVLTLVRAGGDATKVGNLDVKAVQAASELVTTDAKGACNIDIAADTPAPAPSK